MKKLILFVLLILGISLVLPKLAMTESDGHTAREEGEEQMHVSMGKRISGCQPNAPLPQGMMGGMMNIIMGMGNFGNNLMGGFGFGSIV